MKLYHYVDFRLQDNLNVINLSSLVYSLGNLELSSHCQREDNNQYCVPGEESCWPQGVCKLPCWPYARIGIGQFWELCPRYIGIPFNISLCIYGFDVNHDIGFLGVSRGQFLKFMPLIMTIVVPSLIPVG